MFVGLVLVDCIVDCLNSVQGESSMSESDEAYFCADCCSVDRVACYVLPWLSLVSDCEMSARLEHRVVSDETGTGVD